VIDDVLDRLALRHVGKVRHQREVGVPVLDAEVATETVRQDAGDFRGELVQRGLDSRDIRGGSRGLPAEEGNVTQHG